MGEWCWAWCAKTSLLTSVFYLHITSERQNIVTPRLLRCPGSRNLLRCCKSAFLWNCSWGIWWEICAVLRQQILTESCSWSLALAIMSVEALGNMSATAWVSCRVINDGLRVCWGAGAWMQGSQVTWVTWPPYCRFLCMSLKGFGICNLH